MKSSDKQKLEKIKDYCNEISFFLSGYNLEQFLGDLKSMRAVSMTLTQIGELVYKLSDELKNQYNQPWKQIAGLRHRLVHDYGNIDYTAIWEIATENIVDFEKAIIKILNETLEHT